MWTEPLYPEEAACIRGAVEKRRREFTAGRQCARAALASLGIARFPLLVGPQREPLWPPGIVGSISHGAGRCAVVACRAGAIVGLGLDIDSGDPLDANLVPMICTSAERDWCARRPAGHDWPKLVFAIKEAVYKAMQALPGARAIGWRDLEVTRDADGRPAIRLHGLAERLAAEQGGLQIQISLTHSSLSAGAVAVVGLKGLSG